MGKDQDNNSYAIRTVGSKSPDGLESERTTSTNVSLRNLGEGTVTTCQRAVAIDKPDERRPLPLHSFLQQISLRLPRKVCKPSSDQGRLRPDCQYKRPVSDPMHHWQHQHSKATRAKEGSSCAPRTRRWMHKIDLRAVSWQQGATRSPTSWKRCRNQSGS